MKSIFAPEICEKAETDHVISPCAAMIAPLYARSKWDFIISSSYFSELLAMILAYPWAKGEILKTGIPSAVQGAVFCFANIFVQASVNSFGEAAIAGSTVAMNFEYFT